MRFIATLLLAFSLIGPAQALQEPPLPIEQCAAQAPYGFPTTSKKSVTAICRTGYWTIHDNKAKIALVSSYVLKPENTVGCEARDNSFSVDRSLPVLGRAVNKDYAKSDHDIGHLVNAVDLKWSSAAQASAALFSNAAPQLPEFNRGIWKKLEDTTRGWGFQRQHALHIYVGSVYRIKQDPTLKSQGRVTIPHAFFKIITDMETKEVQIYIMKHEGSQAELKTFISSLAEVQRQSGVTLPLPVDAKFTSTWPILLKGTSKQKACTLK